MTNARLKSPWYVAFIAAQPERTKVHTAIEAALFRALERALYDPRHALPRQTFGYYRAPDARGCMRNRAGRLPASKSEPGAGRRWIVSLVTPRRPSAA